jgi:hypothetical protein
LIPTFRSEWLQVINFYENDPQREHPCRTFQLPARHGDGTPIHAGAPRFHIAEARGPTSHKMPFTNLCNRLVVNEHPWDPPIHERPTFAGLSAPSIAALLPSTPVLGSEQ